MKQRIFFTKNFVEAVADWKSECLVEGFFEYLCVHLVGLVLVEVAAYHMYPLLFSHLLKYECSWK